MGSRISPCDPLKFVNDETLNEFVVQWNTKTLMIEIMIEMMIEISF